MMLMALPGSFLCTRTRGIRLSGLSLLSRSGTQGSGSQQNQTANRELQALRHWLPAFCSTALTTRGEDFCGRAHRDPVPATDNSSLALTNTHTHKHTNTHTHTNAHIPTWKWTFDQYGVTLRGVIQHKLFLFLFFISQMQMVIEQCWSTLSARHPHTYTPNRPQTHTFLTDAFVAQWISHSMTSFNCKQTTDVIAVHKWILIGLLFD